MQIMFLLYPCRTLGTGVTGLSILMIHNPTRKCMQQIRKLAESTSSFSQWFNVFFPKLEHFCPFFVQTAQMGLILPRWGLILPRTPPPTSVLHSAVTIPKTSVFYTAVTNPIWQNTPSAQPKTPLFLTWTWKWAKSTTVWAKWTPTGQNVWKVGKTVLEVAKKIFIIFLPNLSSWFAGTGVQNGCLQLFLLYVFACYCLSECTKLFRVWQWLWPTGLWQHLHCQKHSTSNRHPQRY